MTASFVAEDGLQFLQTVVDGSKYESTCLGEVAHAFSESGQAGYLSFILLFS